MYDVDYCLFPPGCNKDDQSVLFCKFTAQVTSEHWFAPLLTHKSLASILWDVRK